MADPSEGEVPPSTGPAKQRFGQLKSRWGVQLTDLDWKKPPDIIMVDVMGDHVETWKRWGKDVDSKKPDLTEYTLIEVRNK